MEINDIVQYLHNVKYTVQYIHNVKYTVQFIHNVKYTVQYIHTLGRICLPISRLPISNQT